LTVERAESLDVERIADTIETVGFECTDCGDCCTAEDEPLAVTVFPDERRRLAEATEASPDEVSEPSPFGGDETFEWTVRRDACGDCFFHDGDREGGGCSAYETRPSVCRTYPFAVRFDEGVEETAEQTYDIGEATLAVGECEGTGRDMDREEALELAREVKERAVKEEVEARDLVEAYEEVEPPDGHVVVHDSEGAHVVPGPSER
jgi:Fe-S-cluster containining protein